MHSPRRQRGQLSLTVIEAAVGVVLILGVAMGFALAMPGPADQATQLDAYARDGATVLANEPPRHADETRLSEVLRSEEAFEREKGALETRVDRILPDNLLFRVITPHGEAGYRQPDGVPTGVATTTTTEGEITIEVWYA